MAESILSALYHGKLCPEQLENDPFGRADILNEAFSTNRERLLRRLEQEPREWLEELLQIHDDMISDTVYGSFRNGFILGGSIVMEICSGKNSCVSS